MSDDESIYKWNSRLLVVSSCGNRRSLMMYSMPPVMLRKAKALTVRYEGRLENIVEQFVEPAAMVAGDVRVLNTWMKFHCVGTIKQLCQIRVKTESSKTGFWTR